MNRTAEIARDTKETSIKVRVDLDGKGELSGSNPLPFFEHMLDHLVRYSMIDMLFEIKGDLEIDAHHTVEDTAICLGEAITRALGEKRGIRRFGSAMLPMDEVLAMAAVDLSGRPYFHYDGPNLGQMPALGGYDSELTQEFLQKLAVHARMNLHVRILEGQNRHHIHEAIFKALGIALRNAVEPDPRRGEEIPSTKGTI